MPVTEIIKSKVKVTDDAVAGAAAGAIARMISAPFDVVKIRFQLQSQVNPKYKSVLQSLRIVVKEEGILSLWKGNLSASYLWISYMMVQFSMYGVLKRFGEKIANPFQGGGSSQKGGDKAWQAFTQFLAGAGAGDSYHLLASDKQCINTSANISYFLGTASVVVTYPFDIMRTQFALQGKNVVFKSMASFIAHTYRTTGVKGTAKTEFVTNPLDAFG